MKSPTPITALGSACALAIMLLGIAPVPAYAWWGKLEKLSGPGPFTGRLYEFRVACFGESIPKELKARIQEAAVVKTKAARDSKARDSSEWQEAVKVWQEVEARLAVVLDEPSVAPTPRILSNGNVDSQQLAEDLEAVVDQRLRRTAATRMSTSSAGVLWSLCEPDKKRRFALDVGWNVWEADGNPQYAGGSTIHLNTLMASVSWRIIDDVNWDFIEVSAGGGSYWFTATGFPTLRGVVLQPGRLTVRAPSAWSGLPLSDFRRWAAIPVYGIGMTVFPSGFGPSDFAGVGDRAVVIPAELIRTNYFFLNVEPFLRRWRK